MAMPQSLTKPTPADQRNAWFIDELTKVSRKIRTLFDARVRAQALTLSRARVLLRLSEGDGQTQSQLACKLEVEQPSMVGILDGLEKLGYIRREAQESDRRVKNVYLTDTARMKARGLTDFSRRLREDMLEGISPADLETATRVLRVIMQNIDSGKLDG
ncbi:MarR family transcriptional regulator [Haematobacter genomosp. 1]|uniref:MarR family transcriptional regulator n=2 Tax=Haematobacter genomosp. 1 TaxID=366618 RepID=A0A212ACG1_9RHOB|nr:MarR family transcriptional regulator [Haematobacter genomosp. 1]